MFDFPGLALAIGNALYVELHDSVRWLFDDLSIDTRARRQHALTTLMELQPGSSLEARLALQVVVNDIHATDCFCAAARNREDEARVRQDRAQGNALQRQSHRALRVLMQMQKARRGAEAGPATQPAPAAPASAPASAPRPATAPGRAEPAAAPAAAHPLPTPTPAEPPPARAASAPPPVATPVPPAALPQSEPSPAAPRTAPPQPGQPPRAAPQDHSDPRRATPSTPETRVPEARAPETRALETRASETLAPEARVPETCAPRAPGPETPAPVARTPDAFAPPAPALAAPPPAGAPSAPPHPRPFTSSALARAEALAVHKPALARRIRRAGGLTPDAIDGFDRASWLGDAEVVAALVHGVSPVLTRLDAEIPKIDKAA